MEVADKQIDAFIERTSNHEEQRAVEALWAESARKERRKRREANRWLWIRHFEALALCLRERAEEFDRKAEELMESEV